MLRIVLILSSLLMAMAPAASVACQAEDLQVDGASTNTEIPVEIMEGDALIDQWVAQLLSDDGAGNLVEDAIKSRDKIAAEEAIVAGCEEAGTPPPIIARNRDSIQENIKDWTVVRALAEAKDGETITDHDSVILTAPDGSITGFADSFAQASAGEGGYARAVSSASISDGGSVISSVAIAKAE